MRALRPAAIAESERVAVRLGFSGDAHGAWRPYPLVQGLTDRELDYFVWLGDTIYEAASNGSPTVPGPFPVFPMFGSGETRLQPAYVGDVAEAIVRVLLAPTVRQLYELAGPRVYTYQELLKTIAASAGTRPFLVRFPFSLWHAIGFVAETLPSPPAKDNIPGPDAPGFEALQISPQTIENILPQMLQAAREKAGG